jgi:3-phenylpropionate/trans-cinnamate dioxygenase ferredoxin component
LPQLFEAARVGEIANRTCKAISVKGSEVAVIDLDGEYFAAADLYTYGGSDLHAGWVGGDRAVCPLHLAESSIRSGETLKAPAYERGHSFLTARARGSHRGAR